MLDRSVSYECVRVGVRVAVMRSTRPEFGELPGFPKELADTRSVIELALNRDIT
jgi:hypothetical protein